MILIQTNNTNLQKNIIAEDLSYEGRVMFGQVMEHTNRKVKKLGKNQGEEEDRVVAL